MTERHSHPIIACMAALALGFSAVTLVLVASWKPAQTASFDPLLLGDIPVLPLPPKDQPEVPLTRADFVFNNAKFQPWLNGQTSIAGSVLNNTDLQLTSVVFFVYPMDDTGRPAGVTPLFVFNFAPREVRTYIITCTTDVAPVRLVDCIWEYGSAY